MKTLGHSAAVRKNIQTFDEKYKKISYVKYQTLDTPSSRISYKSTLSPFTAAGVYAYNNTEADRVDFHAKRRSMLSSYNGNTKCRNVMCGFQPTQSIGFESKYN